MKKFLTFYAVLNVLFVFSLGSAIAENDLINKKCTTCHTTERIDNAGGDQAYWNETMERMKNYGTKLTADEEKQIMDYLSAQK
jgi:hypothetical protein